MITSWLTFHEVADRTSPGNDPAMTVTPDFFAGVLDRVRDRADVRITFDDGNRSDVDTALPLLEERGTRATFFVLADRIDQPDQLTTADLKRLVDAGMTIGSHGRAHVPWTDCDDPQLDAEIAASAEDLTVAVGRPVDHFACPFGAYDRRVLAALRRQGAARVYTSDRGATPSRWLTARTSLHAEHRPEDLDALIAHGRSRSSRWVRDLNSLRKRLR
jgi:peptidoglycan/xylan/chitin deacetylase (PgdA/CDA1 family)